jgi:hypothetical protein
MLLKINIEDIKRHIVSFLGVEDGFVTLYNEFKYLDPRYQCDDYGIQSGAVITALAGYPKPNCRIRVNSGPSQAMLDISHTYQVKTLKQVIFRSASCIESMKLYLEDIELANNDATLEFYGVSNTSCVTTFRSAPINDICLSGFTTIFEDKPFFGWMPVSLVVFPHCFVLLDFDITVYLPTLGGQFRQYRWSTDTYHVEPVIALGEVIYGAHTIDTKRDDFRFYGLSSINLRDGSKEVLRGHNFERTMALHNITGEPLPRIPPDIVGSVSKYNNGTEIVYNHSTFVTPYGSLKLVVCQQKGKYSLYIKPVDVKHT